MFVFISENGIGNVQEESLKTWKLNKTLLKFFLFPNPHQRVCGSGVPDPRPFFSQCLNKKGCGEIGDS